MKHPSIVSGFIVVVTVLAISSVACTIVPATCGGSAPDDCGGYCTNLADDPNNCGGCGLACGPNDACVGGVCTTGGACTPDGYACTYGAECCGGVCDGTNTCTTSAGGCAIEGDLCSTDGDCCNALYCDNGACSVCVSSGNACNVDADCCGGICDVGICN